MQDREALVGKLFVLPQHITWFGSRHGQQCEMNGGEYFIADYDGAAFELRREGERYKVPATTVCYYGENFGSISGRGELVN